VTQRVKRADRQCGLREAERICVSLPRQLAATQVDARAHREPYNRPDSREWTGTGNHGTAGMANICPSDVVAQMSVHGRPRFLPSFHYVMVEGTLQPYIGLSLRPAAAVLHGFRWVGYPSVAAHSMVLGHSRACQPRSNLSRLTS